LNLSQQSGIDIQMSGKIENPVIFTAQNQPFLHVIKALCELTNLRVNIIGGSIRIEEDTPYPVTYQTPFLNQVRSSHQRISVATDVFSPSSTSNNHLDNGSNSQITAKGENDFWNEVKANLATILDSGTFTIHQQGGIISARGTTKQHKLITQYLENLHQTIASQVLIEAKVIEVTLKDEFKSGINWQKIADQSLFLTLPFGHLAQKGTFLPTHNLLGDFATFGLQTKNFSAFLKIIEEFGHYKILSSPRITVMNNQVATLKVAQNQVYFRLHYDKQFFVNSSRENVSVTSDIHTVPIGWILTVQPSIDANHNSVVLSLRPTISRLSHSVPDPAVDIAFTSNPPPHSSQFAPQPSLIPVMEVKEIESVLRLQSGETIILGGLMETRSSQQKSQIPFIGDLPILGALAQSHANSEEVVELVILLKATILTSENNTIISDNLEGF
jgi:general secretion pathway protein D